VGFASAFDVLIPYYDSFSGKGGQREEVVTPGSTQRMYLKIRKLESGAMAHAYNLSYSEGRDWEDWSLRPAQVKS
jgi:hypothetical protein